jgi:hypothetical protein
VSNEITIGNTSATRFRLPGLQAGASNGQVMTYNSSTGLIELASSSGLTGTTTTDNTALGVNALANVSAGTNRNVALGESALANVTSGSLHVAVGYQAGVGQTTGQYNCFVGGYAGGNPSGVATGDGNVAVGYASLGFFTRTSASHNVALGYQALNDITTGGNNIAAGYQAAQRVTTGTDNLTLGQLSGDNLTTSSENVFLGTYTGRYATTASSNICIGYYAGGYSSFSDRLSTGTNNVIIGGYAGDKITTETNNICIGYLADNYDTGISNRITLGNANITSLRIPGIQSGATNGQVLTYNSASGGTLELADVPAAGATGGGSDQIFYENGQTVTTNYTISNGKNAMSAGPITINTGVTVTVGTGETWTVV